MKKLIWMSIVGLSVFGSTAFACSSADVQDKAIELNSKLEQLAEVNPAKAGEISGKLQEESIKQAESGEAATAEQKCDLYAKLIEEVNQELS